MTKEQIAVYAYQNVPFYQNLISEIPKDFEQLPVISKEQMIQELGRNLAPEYMVDYLTGKLDRVLTSGSTGQCMSIYWDEAQQKKSLMPLWYLRKKYYGIMPGDKYCSFYTTRVLKGRCMDKVVHKQALSFSKLGLSESRLLEIYKELLAYEPVWILVQPSMAMLLIQTAEKNGLAAPASVKYVELTGERIYKGTRKKIQDFFGCATASQYGCYEVNSIAYECPQGNMHVMGSNVFVEVLGENDCPALGKEGNIVITSRQNKVMPFIRYKTGDRGTVREGTSCHCGNSSPILELTKARENDMVLNSDGSKTHSDIFAHAVEMVNLATENIVQYQIIQKDYGDFDVLLVLDDEEEGDTTKELLIQALGDFAKGKDFHFIRKDRIIPDMRTGKLAWFRSEFPDSVDKECK